MGAEKAAPPKPSSVAASDPAAVALCVVENLLNTEAGLQRVRLGDAGLVPEAKAPKLQEEEAPAAPAVRSVEDLDQLVNAGSVQTTWSAAKSYLMGSVTDNDTVMDGLLACIMIQVSHGILYQPNAMALTGLHSGISLWIVGTVVNCYTMWLIVMLHTEYRAQALSSGKWTGTVQVVEGAKGGSRVVQYHDIIAFASFKALSLIQQLCLVFGMIWVCAGTVAAAADCAYSDSQVLHKRNWTFVFGGICFLCILPPTLKHYRLMNWIGVLGTTFTAIYIIIAAAQFKNEDIPNEPVPYRYLGVTAWPKGDYYTAHRNDAFGFTTFPIQDGQQEYPPMLLYVGGLVNEGIAKTVGTNPIDYSMMFWVGAPLTWSANGGHAIKLEVMDTMKRPHMFHWIKYGSCLYTMLLLFVPAVVCMLATPTLTSLQQNVFDIFPPSLAKSFSIWLMVIHQIFAFGLYITPVMYITEKIVGTHESAYWKRILTRIPVWVLMVVLALACPQYGVIMSTIWAFPINDITVPTFIWNWYYWKQSNRDASVQRPWGGKWGWRAIWWLNALLFTFFIIISCGWAYPETTRYMKLQAARQEPFPKCYDC